MREQCDELVFAGVRLTQRDFGPFSLADVARNFGGADDHAAAVADRGNRKRDVDQGAALRNAHGLEVVDALTRTNARDDLPLFIVAIFWNN